MSIEEKNKIDFISTRRNSGAIILTISDHLDWGNPSEHLQMLQDKLNSYITFVETGQIFESYPNSLGKQLIIEIVSQYDYNNLGLEFLEKVRPITQSIGIDLHQKILDKDDRE